MRPGLVNVFNQYAALRRKERCRQLAEEFDLLSRKPDVGFHPQHFALALRQHQQQRQISFLQRRHRSQHVIQQALQFQAAGEPNAEIVKAPQIGSLRFQLVAQAGQVGAEASGEHFRG